MPEPPKPNNRHKMSENDEKTFIGKVQKGNRIQIPEPIRELLNIKEGDLVEIKIKKLPKKEVAEGGEH